MVGRAILAGRSDVVSFVGASPLEARVLAEWGGRATCFKHENDPGDKGYRLSSLGKRIV